MTAAEHDELGPTGAPPAAPPSSDGDESDTLLAAVESGGPAMLVVDGHGRLAGVTPAGQVMLDQLPPGTMGPIPDVINALAATVRSPLARGHDEVPTARIMVRGVWGTRLILEAAPLHGEPDRVAISLAPAARHDLAAVLLQAYGLTARETEVALGVLRHETSAQIAAALHLSRWTVQDHLKAVFAKTGVRSRADLALQLFASTPRSLLPDRCPDDRRESGHRVDVARGQLQRQLAQDRRLTRSQPQSLGTAIAPGQLPAYAKSCASRRDGRWRMATNGDSNTLTEAQQKDAENYRR